MQRSEKYKPPLKHDDLVFAVIVLIVVVFVLSMTGCMSFRRPSGPEPKWSPEIYRFAPEQGRCLFKDPETGHNLDCDEPIIGEYLLMHADYFPALFSKFDQCEVWK